MQVRLSAGQMLRVHIAVKPGDRVCDDLDLSRVRVILPILTSLDIDKAMLAVVIRLPLSFFVRWHRRWRYRLH